MMKVGDLVTFKAHRAKHGLIECAEVGVIQDLLPMKRVLRADFDPSVPPKNVYHVRWSNGDISNHYNKEIIIVSEV